MADLELDLGALDQLYQDLLHASIAFGEIDAVSKSVADAVGHDDLAHKVRDFATGWDDRRQLMSESLDALWKAVNAVHDTFYEADVKLGDIVRSKEG